MEHSVHPMQELFAQLGLPADRVSIEGFVRSHAPLAAGILLADAPFWTQSQAAFLREQILNDADWAEVIDQLSLALHR